MELKEITDWLTLNREWLFSGIGIVVIGLIWKLITYFRKNNINQSIPNGISNDSDVSVNNENNISINIGAPNNDSDDKDTIESAKYSNIEDLKNNVYILFIDDDTKFKVVNILKNAGYKNVKIIKDVRSIDMEDVIKADIFFIDIQGVGKRMDFRDEGLGLAKALMEKYGKKKKYIIYSAETHGDRFNEVLRKADDFLPKDADPYQFESIIEKFFYDEGRNA